MNYINKADRLEDEERNTTFVSENVDGRVELTFLFKSDHTFYQVYLTPKECMWIAEKLKEHAVRLSPELDSDVL